MGGQIHFLSSHKRAKAGLSPIPLLYALVTEPLNRRLEWERLNGTIIGLRIARGVKRINHSQFVDDMLLLGGASRVIARRFKSILDQFTQIYGGLVNENKIQIYAWNIDACNLLELAQILSFPISKEWNFFKYLGMPICLKYIPGEYWHIIIQKIKENMENWGSIWLNPAGCLVLIKSILSSLPIFQFSTLSGSNGH
jgi:hypothetical protein